MSDAARIICHPSPAGVTSEQARDTRARAWGFVFECWQQKEMAAEPYSHNDAAIVRRKEGVSHVEQRPDKPSEGT
jgi:hypothetical protein